MKKFLTVFLILFAAAVTHGVRASEMYDFDLRFLDNPFAGQKMITQKEFDSVVNRNAKPKKEPSKFTKWFWGVDKNKQKEIDPNLQHQFNLMPNELGSMKDTISQKPVLTLGASILDSNRQRLTPGHYQVDFKNIDGQDYILFLQAHQTVGRFRATPCKDDYKSNDIIYARLIETDGVYRIIHSNLDGTYQGFARILD